ncbi:MAG: DMT family transporter [Rectinemataceae bacterium]
MDRRTSGAALVAVSAASFGIMPILARYAYADRIGVTTLLFFRFAAGALFMLVFVRVRRRPLPRGKALAGIALMGAVGYVGQSLCYFTALKFASAGLVALLLYVYPALVTILSAVLFRERITPPKVLALALALSGTTLILGFGGKGDVRGVILGLGAALIYSVYIVAGSRIIKEGQSVQASAIIMSTAALVFGILSASGGLEPPHSAAGFASVAAIALVCTVVALSTFFAGMERVGPTKASMISTLEPVVTVTAAAIFLGEPLALLNLVGGGLILGSLFVLAGT